MVTISMAMATASAPAPIVLPSSFQDLLIFLTMMISSLLTSILISFSTDGAYNTGKIRKI